MPRILTIIRRLTFDHRPYVVLGCMVLVANLVAACIPTHVTPTAIDITLIDKGDRRVLTITAGSTIQTALDQAGITLSNIDRIEPPSYTVITSPIEINLTRVIEKFEVENIDIPFERQTVRNESLPEGQTLLIQPGVNGSQKVTYRLVYENEVLTSKTLFKTELAAESLPEIVMVGVQAPFSPVTIPGKLVYLTSGNAWVLENSTGERHPVITTGDLDGRVFSLSKDGNWLLFTRQSDKEPSEEINTLWMANIALKSPQPIFLRVQNIIHFASWVPGKSLRFAYSSVEPRTTAPGWQANNDLALVSVDETGGILSKDEIIEANSGGIYGWWGTTYSWSQDGQELAFARPDSIGWVDFDGKQLVPALDLIPFQTRSDWAWVPEISWSPDNELIYTVVHTAVSGLTTAEVSPLFDLSAIITREKQSITLVAPTGMFAFPSVSPLYENGNFQLAFLQAIFPEQSETSRYRLMLMDQDGSNRKVIFPPEGSTGIDPQKVIWAPGTNSESSWIALIYQGNLWLINPFSGKIQQITGDGSIVKIDWK